MASRVRRAGKRVAMAAGRAALGVFKSSPLGRAASALSSVFGGGIDHRKASLKALRKAAARGDLQTILRKASQSKYAKVRGIASAILAQKGQTDYRSAQAAYQASKGQPRVESRPMASASPVLRADPYKARRREATGRIRSSSGSRTMQGKRKKALRANKAVRYRGKWYSAKQARFFVPSRRRR